MAGYDITARRLKPLVDKASFTPEQLTIVNRMMRGCWALRSGDLCSKFLSLMLPDNMQLVKDTNNPKLIQTRYGEKTFYPMYVIKEGEEIPKLKTNIEVGICEVCKQNKSAFINSDGLEVCEACHSGEDE